MKSRIIRFLTKGNITLTSNEEKALACWEDIDHHLRCGIEYPDILLKITLKWGISRTTFNAYYSNTQEVFSRSRRLNKKYHIHLQAELMEQDIRKYRKSIFEYQDPKTKEIIPVSPDAKDMMALAKLYDARAKLLSQLPDESEIVEIPKPVTIYQLPGEDVLQLPMSIEKALALTDKLKSKGLFEDIEHEDLSNEANEPTD